MEEKNENFVEKILNILPDYLRKRIIPALVMIPLAVFLIYSPFIIFSVFVLIIAVLMAFEWIGISKTEFFEDKKWTIMGLIYIVLPCISLLYIKNREAGSEIILWLFLVVWATDIAGLMVGSNFKGPKLAPSISPNKTWSGLIGGVLASMFIGLLFSVVFEGGIMFIGLSGFLACLEQIGDLIESKFKRTFGVKDSGTLIPGHGGVLDRLDGLTLVAPFVALLVLFSIKLF